MAGGRNRSNGAISRRLWTIDIAYDIEGSTGPAFRRLWTICDLHERVATLAGMQAGIASRCQLFALGVGRGQVDYWLRRRRLLPLHDGVYAVGHDDVSARGLGMAALLAAGRGSALAQDTAAGFWDLAPDRSEKPHVIVPAGTSHKRSTLHAHRPTDVQPGDVTSRFGLHLTSPMRTLLDIAPSWPPDRLARAIREARVLGLVEPRRLRDRAAGRPGATAIRGALDGPTSEPTRSETEARFARLIARTDLPRPLYNERVNGKRRDACFPEHGLIIEFDAISTHGDAVTFEADRARDNAAALHELETRRFTRIALRDDPLRVLTTIAFRLGALGARRT